jgi:hypothetical protein
MKIFGIEIKRSQTNAESPVKLPAENSQNTKESLPLKKAFPRAELGDTGVRSSKGNITEEYNPNLQGIQAIKVYDEMRRSDGTVRAAMLVTSLPIRRAKWFINPTTQEEKDKEVAEFVERALFEWIDSSWDDIVRQALLMLPFGVMLFEKVYGVKDHDGKTYVTIEKLAPRLPKSINSWELTDGTFGIQQYRQDGQMAQIPGSKLLIFVNEKEGDNWWGTSMLRAAYRHWYHKDVFYKIDGVAFERQGLGVPLIKMPKGYTASDEAKAIQAAENLRSSESAYLILPPDYEAEFMNMGASTTRDPQNSINHHNKQILQSVLAQFLELGQTQSGGGSRALSEDQTDLFLKAMEAIAHNIVTVINKDLIPELVDMNYDDVTIYPKLDFSGISRTDVTALGTAFAQLVTAKGITPTMKDEVYLRALLGLPEVSEEEVDAELDGVDVDDPDGPDALKTQNKNVDDGADDVEEEDATPEDKKKIKEAMHARNKKLRKFDDGKGFMSWRKLTFTEQKVSFENIEDQMNTLQEKFEKEATELLNKAKDTFIAKLQTALDDDDKKAVAELEIKFVSDYKKLLKDFMRVAYEYGKTNASTEVGVNSPPNSADTMASIDLLADTIAWKAAIDLETKAKTSAVNGLKKVSASAPNSEYMKKRFASIIQVVGLIDASLETSVSKVVTAAAGLIINQAINMGRKDVFDRHKDKIYALQRSEILDETTCDFCLSVDGRVVDKDDSWASEDSFHNNCRGIWVEILKEEPDPPEIEGIPDNVGDYYGGEPNALIQPPKPIVRPDSPALEEVERRADEKKKNKKKK